MTTKTGALLLAALTLLAAGCGGGQKTETTSAETAATSPPIVGTPTTSAPDVRTPAPGATEAPTSAAPAGTSTAAPTEAPTQAPTQAPTSAATAAPASGGGQAPASNPNGPCNAATVSGTPATKPPEDLAIPGQARLYRSQGANSFDAVVEATTDMIPSTRDDAVAFLGDRGYGLVRTQDKSTTQALATLQGPQHKIEVFVSPLCQGKINIHYTIG